MLRIRFLSPIKHLKSHLQEDVFPLLKSFFSCTHMQPALQLPFHASLPIGCWRAFQNLEELGPKVAEPAQKERKEEG
jgi:hypothetical protein